MTQKPPSPRRLAPRLVVALAPVLVALAALWWLGRPPELYLGGIQVNEPDHQVWAEALRASGLDTVAVTVYAKQGDWDSANLWWEDEEPAVVSEMRAARTAGLKVVLILRVALDHAFERNRFLWHGMIMPDSDAQLAEWFRRYGELAEKWAAIAETEGVDLLGVSSELSALTNTMPVFELPALYEYYLNPEKQAEHKEQILAHDGALTADQLWTAGADDPFPSPEAFLDAESAANARWARQVVGLGSGEAPLAHINRRRRLLEEHWRRVIAGVRRHYTGPLTYAANFDQYREVGFWDALEVMGINAYFPLREEWRPVSNPVELYPDLLAGWRAVLGGIDAFRSVIGLPHMPVLFTEMGLTSRANSTLRPWAGTGFALVPTGAGDETRVLAWADQPESPRERALALRALGQVNRERGGDLLAGLLYWKLSTIASHEEEEPFVLLISQPEVDPALPELLRLRHRSAAQRLHRGLERLAEGAATLASD